MTTISFPTNPDVGDLYQHGDRRWVCVSDSPIKWQSVTSYTIFTPTVITAFEDQTTFNVNYYPGLLVVYVNGSILYPEDYSANNGSTVVLTSPAKNGEQFLFLALSPFRATVNAPTEEQVLTALGNSIGNMEVPSINGSQVGGFRNKIFNGAMQIAQTGTSFVSPVNNTKLIDMFTYYKSGEGICTIEQSSDAPVGFVNSLKLTTTTVDDSLAASDFQLFANKIEGYNVTSLISKPFTISFWVKSSKVGKYTVSLTNNSTSSLISEYTINQSNVWEKKSITIQEGINNSIGTWNFTNGVGLHLRFTLCSGSNLITSTKNSWLNGNYVSSSEQVNLFDTLGNTFLITGIQLEEGTRSTPFEHIPYFEELERCKRYYRKNILNAHGYATSANAMIADNIVFPKEMRATPTITFDGTTGPAIYGNCSAPVAGSLTSSGFYLQVSSAAAGLYYVLSLYYIADARL